MGVVKLHETTIDGTLYKTKTLTATEGLDLGQELARLLVDGLLDLLLQNPEEFSTEKLFSDPMQIGILLAKSAQKAPGGEFSKLAKDILRHTVCHDEASNSDHPLITKFDSHFAGRYMHLLSVIGWVLSVSFGGS